MIEIIETINTVELVSPTELDVDSETVVTRLDVLAVGPQGPPGVGNVGNLAVGEVPSGLVNGVNQDYSTVNNFVALYVFLNGLRMTLSEDYTITGANTFHFLYPPSSGDKLRVDYFY